MNREIKFRGFDNGKMFYGIESVYDGNNGGDITDRDGNEIDIYEANSTQHFGEWIKSGRPLMQYTGLLDKFGKEIYEGDIILSNPEKYESRVGEKVVVKYDVCGFAPFTWETTGFEPEKVEIIGNIHENHTLL